MSLKAKSSAVRSPFNGAAEKISASAEAVPQALHVHPFSSPSEDAIAKLAYHKFITRGREHGHHEEDWAAAKRDLLCGICGY